MFPVADLVVLKDLYPRGSVDAKRVALFAELLTEDPAALPPVRVACLDGIRGYVVSDGVHRLDAHRKIGAESITVEMWGAADRTAIYFDALRMGAESARPLTRAEKQQAVARLVAGGHSQREIGRLLGIPQSTVNDWVTGSGQPGSRVGRAPVTKAERVADQLGRAVGALERMVEENEEGGETFIVALLDALGPRASSS